MLIWLINPYGPIPGEGWRPYRFELIGHSLAAKGYKVVWWTSTFSHHSRRQRSDDWEDRAITANFTLRLVPSPTYKKNLGLGRVARDLMFGIRTYLRSRNQNSPDLIYFYESPFTFGLAGYWLARKFKARMVFDQVDLWPEIVEKALSPAAKLLTKPVTALAYMMRTFVYHRLHGSVALAKPYLDVMHRVSPILRTLPTAVAYNGIDVASFRTQMTLALDDINVRAKKESDVWVIFAGSLGETYDIPTILQAAQSLRGEPNLVFLIAGDGPQRGKVSNFAQASDNNNLYYLGKLDPKVLIRLYVRCDIGLCAYSARSNVEMPDKIYDYTAAGLAVVNSLTGEVASVISTGGFGMQYRAGCAHDLSASLARLARDPVLLKSMKDRSFKAGGGFDQAVQVGKIVKVVDDVLEQA